LNHGKGLSQCHVIFSKIQMFAMPVKYNNDKEHGRYVHIFCFSYRLWQLPVTKSNQCTELTKERSKQWSNSHVKSHHFYSLCLLRILMLHIPLLNHTIILSLDIVEYMYRITCMILKNNSRRVILYVPSLEIW